MVLHMIKEQLKTWHLKRLWWCCTEEMVADGLNKGAVSRKALTDLALNGMWILRMDRRCFSESQHTPLKGQLATLAAVDETQW